MNELIDVVGLRQLLPAALVEESSDFERLYDRLTVDEALSDVRCELETRVRDYFQSLRLPAEATLYDRLVVGLRPKDLIATFNWDPLLVQAFRRNLTPAGMPRVAFLHGNVAIGSCNRHLRMGYLRDRCDECGASFQPVSLLYPVSMKDYTSDVFLRGQWAMLEDVLSTAYFVTIIGYGAPQSDAAAVELMTSVWQANGTMDLAQIEIIDIVASEELRRRWSRFVVREHFHTATSFEDSWISSNPRRSCEALATFTLDSREFIGKALPSGSSLEELHEAVAPLVDEERAYEEHGTPFRMSWAEQ